MADNIEPDDAVAAAAIEAANAAEISLALSGN